MVEPRWRMLAVLFLARTVLGLQFQTIASTEAGLRTTLGIGFAEIGTLIGLYMLPGILLSLPGGVLVRRFGEKQLCCAGLVLMAAGGVVIGFGHDYGSVLAGRLVSGIGGVFLSVAVTKMTTDWFAGREIVTAMSVMLASWPFGIAIALSSYGPLAAAQGWPAVMFLAAAACLAATGLIGVAYRAPSANRTMSGGPSLRASLALPCPGESLPVIVAGLAWGALNLGLIAFFSFVPPLLTANGFAPPASASVTSLALWLTMLSMPIGGHWVQKTGRPEIMTAIFSLLVGGALAGLAFAPSNAVYFTVAVGLLLGPPPGAIMAMPGRVLRPENRAIGLGLYLTVYYVAVGLGPGVAGVLRDRFGPSAPIWMAAGLFGAIAPLAALYRRLGAGPS